jgi:hypothetical protein
MTSACSIRWGLAQIRAIVDYPARQLKKRLIERNLELTLDDSALDLLSEAGYDPVYGARPLKRAIQQQVENPLAQAILSGKFLPGDRIKAHANRQRAGVRQGTLTTSASARRPQPNVEFNLCAATLRGCSAARYRSELMTTSVYPLTLPRRTLPASYINLRESRVCRLCHHPPAGEVRLLIL